MARAAATLLRSAAGARGRPRPAPGLLLACSQASGAPALRRGDDVPLLRLSHAPQPADWSGVLCRWDLVGERLRPVLENRCRLVAGGGGNRAGNRVAAP